MKPNSPRSLARPSALRWFLIISTVAVVLVLVLLFRVSYVFHTNQQKQQQKPQQSDTAVSSTHHDGKKEKHSSAELHDQLINYRGNKQEIKYERFKAAVDSALVGGGHFSRQQQLRRQRQELLRVHGFAHEKKKHSSSEHNNKKQQQQHGNMIDDGENDDDDLGGLKPQRVTDPPLESGIVTERRVSLPQAWNFGPSGAAAANRHNKFVAAAVEEQDAEASSRHIRVTDVSLVLLSDDSVNLVGKYVRRCRDFFPVHHVRLWKERLVHMWSMDPLLHRHHEHHEMDNNNNNEQQQQEDTFGGHEDDIDEKEFEDELKRREIDSHQYNLPPVAQQQQQQQQQKNSSVLKKQQEERIARLKEKLKKLRVGPDEATGKDFVFATNNDGKDFGMKVMSRENVDARRKLASDTIRESPETFAYTKWELRRDSDLHRQIKDYFDSEMMRRSVCRMLDADCPRGFVKKAHMGDFFVSLMEHSDFLSAHNDVSLGEVTVVAHFLVDKKALHEHLVRLRKQYDGGTAAHHVEEEARGRGRGGGGAAVGVNDNHMDARRKKMDPPAGGGEQAEDDFFGLVDPEDAAEAAALDYDNQQKRLHSTLLDANASGAVQFYCFDKKGWCLDLPVSKNELVVFTSKLSSPHRVTLMKDPRYLRFAVTAWFGMDKSKMMLEY